MTKLSILDVLIIGGGPAGLSAALTLGRQRHTIIVFDSERYRNDPSESLHLIPSWDRKSPEGFRASARLELGTYDTVQIKTCEVVSVTKSDDGHFEATDVFGMGYSGRKLILANGVYEIFPDISGYRECWGNSIFHYFFCHGYEKRGGKSSGILAMQMIAIPKFAVHMAHMAAQLTPQVTIYTNGNEQLAQEVMAIPGDRPPWKVDKRVIKSLKKDAEAGLEIYFEDGIHMNESFLGHSTFTHVNGPFAEQLGLKLTPTGDYNVVPPFSETSVQGVYAVGDCMTMFKGGSECSSFRLTDSSWYCHQTPGN